MRKGGESGPKVIVYYLLIPDCKEIMCKWTKKRVKNLHIIAGTN